MLHSCSATSWGYLDKYDFLSSEADLRELTPGYCLESHSSQLGMSPFMKRNLGISFLRLPQQFNHSICRTVKPNKRVRIAEYFHYAINTWRVYQDKKKYIGKWNETQYIAKNKVLHGMFSNSNRIKLQTINKGKISGKFQNTWKLNNICTYNYTMIQKQEETF